jgi:hypothetical protein
MVRDSGMGPNPLDRPPPPSYEPEAYILFFVGGSVTFP